LFLVAAVTQLDMSEGIAPAGIINRSALNYNSYMGNIAMILLADGNTIIRKITLVRWKI